MESGTGHLTATEVEQGSYLPGGSKNHYRILGKKVKKPVVYAALGGIGLLVLVIVVAVAMSGSSSDVMTCSEIQSSYNSFAEIQLEADLSALSAGDRQALSLLVNASKPLNDIYLNQVWSGNVALLSQLKDAAAGGSSCSVGQLDLFNLNYGPWSGVDNERPFVKGVGSQPPGANFYPEGVSASKVLSWISTLEGAEQTLANGFYSVIRYRDQTRELEAVPYSDAYQAWLNVSQVALRSASSLVSDAPFAQYLEHTAEAFASNNYTQMQVDWVQLSTSLIDLTIGPYEVYLDALLNKKAAFEAYVNIVSVDESQKLQDLIGFLQDIEDNLPVADAYRGRTLGASAVIQVVDTVYNAGEAAAGVQTAAYNLPNDERITSVYGSKRILLHNIQKAKFNAVLTPIANTLIEPALLGNVTFSSFFTHILAHELMHGLGPHEITVDGRNTTVRASLQQYYSSIEEAKADISGLWMLRFLLRNNSIPGIMQPREELDLYVTFCASMFRSVRFGIEEAHARGAAMQFNYIHEQGGVIFNEQTGKFSVDVDKFRTAVEQLTSILITLQGEGNKGAAGDLLSSYGTISPVLRKGLDKLGSIPVDIRPVFPQV